LSDIEATNLGSPRNINHIKSGIEDDERARDFFY
jgi:hypothetical protein